MNTQLFGGHLRSSDTVCNLLKSDVTRIIWTAVVGLLVDAEGREAAIVSRTKALLVDILGCGDQLVAHFLHRFGSRTLRDDTADIGHLWDTFGIIPQVLAD